MTRIAYFDLANGISGDMALAALAHAGRRLGVAVEGAIADAVASLPLGCTVSFVDDERGGIACLRADVKAGEGRYTPAELREGIGRADAGAAARAHALDALSVLVGAEAKIHGTDVDHVHLHELASADTAADLLGAAVGLDALGIDTVASAPVPVPRGWIRSGHGPLPLPAPVVLELLTGAALIGADDESELVTPSGAAILVAHDASFGPVPAITLDATGVGAGTRIGDRPNICRVLVGTRLPAGGGPTEERVLLEANIDDQTPEALGHALEVLLELGALDAWVTPIVMKKTRPAFVLSVLVHRADEERLTIEVFRHTSTIGLRRREIVRRALEREALVVQVRGAPVHVKVARLSGEVVNVAPEHDDCVAVARATDVPLPTVYDEALAAALHVLGD